MKLLKQSVDSLGNTNTNQRDFWSGHFGNEYASRNNSFDEENKLMESLIGTTFTEIVQDFFVDIDKNSKILEIGCNVGLRLLALKKLGFTNLHGVEMNKNAFSVAKQNLPNTHLVNSSFEDFLVNENEFDLVFTTDVLIHINPNSLDQIVQKMIQITKKYIFGFEYYSDTLTEIQYRGHSGMLWKQNFPSLFTKYSNLNSVKEKKYLHKSNDLCDIAYLLTKNS